MEWYSTMFINKKIHLGTFDFLCWNVSFFEFLCCWNFWCCLFLEHLFQTSFIQSSFFINLRIFGVPTAGLVWCLVNSLVTRDIHTHPCAQITGCSAAWLLTPGETTGRQPPRAAYGPLEQRPALSVCWTLQLWGFPRHAELLQKSEFHFSGDL
jgi:hypothetical protein